MPHIQVAQLHLNGLVSKEVYLLREKSVGSTRNGSTMLRVLLADSSGSIPGIAFDPPARMLPTLIEGQGVQVSGRVNEFKGQMQIAIDRIVPCEITRLEDYLPSARRPLQEMAEEFAALVDSVENDDLALLLDTILTPERRRAFETAPAAKFNHHACVGGLMEHTLAVTRLALTACDLYPEADRDLVMTACILHDIGKIHSYDPTTFDLTEEGNLWTHLYMGASLTEKTIDGLEGFDEELRLRLVHAILAHHGERSKGSPAEPMTLEAMILHHADELDAIVRGALDHYERTADDGGAFTNVSFMHDNKLFRGTARRSTSQGTLF